MQKMKLTNLCVDKYSCHVPEACHMCFTWDHCSFGQCLSEDQVLLLSGTVVISCKHHHNSQLYGMSCLL